MTLPRLILAALISAGGLVLLTPTAAQACSCARGDAATYAAWADVVFTGTLVETTPPPDRPIMSSGDPATYSFDVDRVHQGEVGPAAEVRSAVSGASCGLEGMRTGSRYAVFATRDAGLWANLCSGTRLLRPAVARQLDRVVGPARAPTTQPPPDTTGSVASAGPDTAAATAAAGTAGAADVSDALPGLPGLALAAGLLVTLGGVLALRRRW
jgi:hypothetical protein